MGLIGAMLAGCGTPAPDTTAQSAVTDAVATALANYKQDNTALTLDNTKWQYDADNNVYYQIGVGYCSNPATTDYETMGIYVPGAYMTAKDNGNGTYTCTVNASGKVGKYTATTAPVVLPVNTPGYMAQQAPTEYSYDGLSDYLKAGFIYVYAGMRGRSNGYDDANKLTYSGGAPWGVTDLKAAVRYYRMNAGSLPGDVNQVYSFGMSGGGAQSALMGATGDSTLYYAYLTSIGAAMTDAKGNYISDAVTGSMCWCPITALDEANEAYEWNMGQFSTSDTRADGTWTAALSDDMAAQFAEYVNTLGLKDKDGNALTLEKSTDGIYLAGSYYHYLVSEIETSLNHFLTDTTFPYTESTAFNASGNFGGGGGAPQGNGIQGSGGAAAGAPAGMQGGTKPQGMPQGGTKPEGMPQGGPTGGTQTEAKTYQTVQDYIAALNANGPWVTYDAATNTAKITSLADFVKNCKTATKSVGAFDAPDRSQGENDLFGNDASDSLHFDSVMAQLLTTNKEKYAALSGWNASYPTDFTTDLAQTDTIGTSMADRMNMYNPMYYVSETYKGYGASTLAKYWRIRTGIEQGDTALTTETNLALALQMNSNVKNVDFETVWGMKHTLAERTGDSTTNFIDWVNSCVSKNA